MTLSVLVWLACMVVLAEGLNKLQRADLFDGRRGWRPRLEGLAWLLQPWAWRRERVVMGFKAAGWALISLGAGGGLVKPFLSMAWFSADGFIAAGFALLIVRSRIKEG
jgi:hypothetical protein